MLGRMWKNWITHMLEVGKKKGTAILEDSLSLSEMKHATTVQPSPCTPRHLFQRNGNYRFTSKPLYQFIAWLFVVAQIQSQPKCLSYRLKSSTSGHCIQ